MVKCVLPKAIDVKRTEKEKFHKKRTEKEKFCLKKRTEKTHLSELMDHHASGW
jgi:hypothetical protein